MREALITAGGVSIRVRLRDSATANEIWEALPIEAGAMTWGEEVYFSTPVSVAREDGARDVVEPGEIAYWPERKSVV